MEHWTDQGLLLSARTHGDSGAVAKLFTETRGLFAGYVYGAASSATRPALEPGTLVQAGWSARTHDQLGTLKLEILQQPAALMMQDRLKLTALHAICALLELTLPEREPHTELFHTTAALLTIMAHGADNIESWGASYVKWEISLLRELGFSLDLSRCAGGGSAHELAYISPKSGCAVSYRAGEPYKDKLLPLPAFLKPNGGPSDCEEILKGLNVTLTFLEKWVFAQHTQGVPDARTQIGRLIATSSEAQTVS